MEIFRDMALAEHENLSDEEKLNCKDNYNKSFAGRRDSFWPFRHENLRTAEWVNTSELFRKPNWDFEDFLTVSYVIHHKETVMVCEGCSSLLTGTAFFTCSECFSGGYIDGRYDLCSNCYRSKNFKDHRHTFFMSFYSMAHRCRESLVKREKEKESRNEAINKALSEFGKNFMELGKSISHDSDEWMRSLGMKDVSSPPKPNEEPDDGDDLIGAKATEKATGWTRRGRILN